MVWFSLVCVLFLSYFVKFIRERASQSLEILNELIMCCHQLSFLQADPETVFGARRYGGSIPVKRRKAKSGCFHFLLAGGEEQLEGSGYVHGCHSSGAFEVFSHTHVTNHDICFRVDLGEQTVVNHLLSNKD